MSFNAAKAWERVRVLAPFPRSLEPYYMDLLSQYENAHNVASTARSQGLDPKETVESKTVFDLADRVNQMLGLDQFEGLVDRLRALLKSTTKERAALTISQEIALGRFGMLERDRALDYGVRAGLAVMTDGVTVAPIEGIYEVAIKQNADNSDYASISYAGPMRSAGGTEAGFSLVIADVTAKKLGLSNYHAETAEIDRFAEELRIYEREVGNFQYKVTDEDIRHAISNLPVEIDGVETNPIEVVVHRNLKRVSTDRLRGGALRVLNDGVIGRAHKLAKKLSSLNITGWEWLLEIKGGTQQSTNETEQAGAHFEEIISGRAVLSMPARKGGFRLRYGRAMNTGLSTIGIHPAVTVLLGYPVVPGTQIKVDIPGKASTIAFVDSIEGPTVLLKDGSVRKVRTIQEAEFLRDNLERIIDLGDALVSYGDFLENNKNLSPSPYVHEWWTQELTVLLKSIPGIFDRLQDAGVSREAINGLVSQDGAMPSLDVAVRVSRTTGVRLHPSFTPRFDKLTSAELEELRNSSEVRDHSVVVDVTSSRVMSTLRSTLIEYTLNGSKAVVDGIWGRALSILMDLPRKHTSPPTSDPLEYVKSLSGISIGSQSTATVGIRIGRPEKAMVRKLKPPVHSLFPIGFSGGQSRDLLSAANEGPIEVEVTNIFCPECQARRLAPKCGVCGAATVHFLTCPRCGTNTNESACPNCRAKTVTYSKFDFDLKAKLESLKSTMPYDRKRIVKGVRGLTSASKTPEPLEKGIIRSRHNTYVYKDGTLRIDITNAPLTHFRPSDAGLEISVLRKLGYDTDKDGVPLTSNGQLLELKPQDIIVPAEVAGDLLNMAQFVDDELQTFYNLPPFYKAEKTTDLAGKIVIGLAPHTSVGVVGRVVGFSATQVCYANPCWHSAKRRDCDGDGDSVLLLLDALLNFSLEYVPHQIGGMMDTPLLVQPIILPAEVDEQSHNFDVCPAYPLQFYEMTKASPPSSALENSIERIGSRLSNENQFFGYKFTHATNILAIKRSRAAYSTLRTLNEKIAKQVEVATKLEAVSAKEVVEAIIKTHLIRDLMGNAKKYASQSFKCKKCGATIRRPPLTWDCPRCHGEIKGTLTRASVEKYLPIAQRLAREYDVEPYLKSRLLMVQRELDQLFQGARKADQLELTEFLHA